MTDDPRVQQALDTAASEWRKNEAAIKELQDNSISILADAVMSGANIAELGAALGYSRQYLHKRHAPHIKEEIRRRLERLKS